MFLGLNEIKYSKGRYLLVILVMALIAWLIFILSGLANGLAQGNRDAIDDWQADRIVLSEEANKNLNVSVLDSSLENKISNGEVAEIGQMSLAVRKESENESELTNISLFGINEDQFLMPKIIDGDSFLKKNEVVASEELKNQGFQIGDRLTAGKYDEQLKIVGWIEESSYSIQPVLYTSLETWQAIKYGDSPAMKNMVNGFVLRDKEGKKATLSEGDVQVIPINTFIEKLPGYSAQKITLDGMIYFLIGIAAFIVGIFIFVMTLQKVSLFGVLKVQGVPTGYLAKSVLLQTTILAVIGVGFGLLLTGITVLFLPDSMPYTTDYFRMILFSILLIVAAIIGGAFSIRTVAKVDPLIAIGG